MYYIIIILVYDKLYFNVFDELKKYYNLSSNKK